MSELTINPVKLARLAHETNRVWCQIIGDFSQPVWDEAPEWQRQSAIAGVLFHMKHPDASPSASHDNWLDQKIRDGWVYGEVKNASVEPPTHPCMVPFEELPIEQQVKDHLFRSVVHSVIRNIQVEVAEK